MKQESDEMIPWCSNSPFVPLTNRFSASDVSSEERGENGEKRGDVRNFQTISSAPPLPTHMLRSWMSENHSFPSLMSVSGLWRAASQHRSKNAAKTPSQLFFFFICYWNIFTEYEGRKHLDLSQWVQSGSLFRSFSTFHTHGALWVMLKRSCVQDVDGLLIWNSFPSLTMWHIWYVNWRLDSLKPSSLHHTSFSILAARE